MTLNVHMGAYSVGAAAAVVVGWWVQDYTGHVMPDVVVSALAVVLSAIIGAGYPLTVACIRARIERRRAERCNDSTD